MQHRQQQDAHQRQQLEKAVHVLLQRRHLAAALRIAHVPPRGELVQHERQHHQHEQQRIDLQQQHRQQRHAELGEHQKMQQRFGRAGGVLDVGTAVAQPIGEARGDPQRHDHPRQHPAGRSSVQIGRRKLGSHRWKAQCSREPGNRDAGLPARGAREILAARSIV